MVRRLIPLAFAIRRHSPTGKRVGGAVLGAVAAGLTWFVVLAAEDRARPDVYAMAMFAWLVGWTVGPLLTSAAPPLRPEYFRLLPLPGRRLGVGLLAASYVGVGPVVTLAATASTVGLAVVSGAGWVAVLLAGCAALALTALMVAWSRVVHRALGAALSTRIGTEIAGVQYGLLLAGLFAGWVVVSPALEQLPRLREEGLAGAAGLSHVVGLAPTSWGSQAVDAVASRANSAAVGWTVALLALAAGVNAWAARALDPTVHARPRARALSSRALPSTLRPGAVARSRSRATRRPGRRWAASPTLAVLTKEVKSWHRDPWRRLEVRAAIWFGGLLLAIGLVTDTEQLVPLSGLALASMAALSGANVYGQDGTALWQLVVAHSDTAIRADVRGRQLGLVVVFGGPAIVLTAVTMLLPGTGASALDLLALLVCLLGVGVGVAAFASVAGVVGGVDPHLRVNATDVGENTVAIIATLWATLALEAPTLLLVGLPLLGVETVALGQPAHLVVGVLNGAVVAWAGGALAQRRLSRRLPETFARVRAR